MIIGIKNITYLSWILIAKLEFDSGNAQMAVNIVNNSILNMENDNNVSEFFAVMFKSLSAEIMLKTNSNIEQALFCAEQAFDTALKYKLNIYLPQIADMLLFIYNTVMSGQQSQEVVQSLNQKIEYVKNSMAQFIQPK